MTLTLSRLGSWVGLELGLGLLKGVFDPNPDTSPEQAMTPSPCTSRPVTLALDRTLSLDLDLALPLNLTETALTANCKPNRNPGMRKTLQSIQTKYLKT